MVNVGLVVVPNTTRSTGPWLGATHTASLQRVANRPIICHALDTLVKVGSSKLCVISPPDVAEEVVVCIAENGPRGVHIHHLVHDPADPADTLIAAAELVGRAPCIMHRADGLLAQPLSPFLELLHAEPSDGLLLVQDDDHDARRLRLVPHAMLETSADAGVHEPPGIAGVQLLGPGMLQHLATLQSHEQTLDLTRLAQRLADAGKRVHVRFVHKWRHFAGDALDLLYMNRALLETLDADLAPAATDGNHFEGPIVIHPTARIVSSVIIGPVIIGADALIADSYIGPHTSIAERVRIEGAELERSIVLADASVLHVGGRLVASVVGRQARIFRDFSMPRALRLQVGDGDEVALC